LVKHDRLLEGLPSLRRPHLSQVGEAEHGLGPREIRIEFDGLLRRCESLVEIAERRVEFRKPRKRQRILRIHLDCFLDSRPRARQVKPGLLRVGQRDPCGGRARIGGHILLGNIESLVLFVLD
jgi:hypothetical protein